MPVRQVANPDGYTLMVSASVHVINPFLYKKTYRTTPVKDFMPITPFWPNGPAGSWPRPAERAGRTISRSSFDPRPARIRTSSRSERPGLGLCPAISRSKLIKRDAGIDALVIAYKGTGSGADRPDERPDSTPRPIRCCPRCRWPQSGKIKALGLTSLKRAGRPRPEIPTVEESGMKGFEFVSWLTGCGRRRVCRRISRPKLQADIAKVLARALT